MRISDWSSDVCSSDLQASRDLLDAETQQLRMLRELRFDGSDQAAATGKARQPLRDAHFRLAVQGGDAAIECFVQLHARPLDCIAWLRERNRNAEIPLERDGVV